MLCYELEEISIIFIELNFFQILLILKSHVNAKQKIILLTYAKFAYMQNLRICKSLPCVQGLSDLGLGLETRVRVTQKMTK